MNKEKCLKHISNPELLQEVQKRLDSKIITRKQLLERNDDKEPAGNKMRKIMGQKASKALINKEKNPENIELFSPLVCYDN